MTGTMGRMLHLGKMLYLALATLQVKLSGLAGASPEQPQSTEKLYEEIGDKGQMLHSKEILGTPNQGTLGIPRDCNKRTPGIPTREPQGSLGIAARAP